MSLATPSIYKHLLLNICLLPSLCGIHQNSPADLGNFLLRVRNSLLNVFDLCLLNNRSLPSLIRLTIVSRRPKIYYIFYIVKLGNISTVTFTNFKFKICLVNCSILWVLVSSNIRVQYKLSRTAALKFVPARVLESLSSFSIQVGIHNSS